MDRGGGACREWNKWWTTTTQPSEARRTFFYHQKTTADLDLSPWLYPVKTNFLDPFQVQLNYLSEALARLGSHPSSVVALDFLEDVGRKLPITFTLLKSGHRGRAGVEVGDEYDVQHILHSVLVLHFEEVEPEEPTPTMAGGVPMVFVKLDGRWLMGLESSARMV
ncbi:hypothetical protein [Nocardia xishanensis]|uniref:Uncharacterized protein n=1 Tax=Nocardia xishanensis TaxID=238964 RepID=A0ABW7XAR5_9NOCA